jgi:hypothetical protein
MEAIRHICKQHTSKLFRPNNRQPHSVRTLDDLRDAASVNRVVINRSNVISIFLSVNDI